MTTPTDQTRPGVEGDEPAAPGPGQAAAPAQNLPEARPAGDAVQLDVVKDEIASIYFAIAGDAEVGGIPYNLEKDGRTVLFATSVVPEFRGHGVATELIRRALDDVRAHGKTVTVLCPIMRSFIDQNPQYRNLVDTRHPGLTQASHRL